MKKLFSVLFCTLVMAGTAFADEPSYEIDSVATAKAPWKVGEKIIKEGHCSDVDYYREFLGITQSGLALVQNFYSSGEKLSDPTLMTITNAEKETKDSCWEGIEPKASYTQWHKNGKKWSEIHFKDGALDGTMTIWYENGQKMAETHHKNNKKVGVWRAWDKKGKLIKEQDFGDPKD